MLLRYLYFNLTLFSTPSSVFQPNTKTKIRLCHFKYIFLQFSEPFGTSSLKALFYSLQCDKVLTIFKVLNYSNTKYNLAITYLQCMLSACIPEVRVCLIFLFPSLTAGLCTVFESCVTRKLRLCSVLLNFLTCFLVQMMCFVLFVDTGLRRW